MQNVTIHNPNRYMIDLRQTLAQGRKRIGILIGAGAPTAIRVDQDNQIIEHGGHDLVPDVAGLTDSVIEALSETDRQVIDKLKPQLKEPINIETVLTQVRRLAQAIGSSCVHGLDATAYDSMAQRICDEIGRCVSASLPNAPNPYSEVASWIAGTRRKHSIEVFTPNYDLLMEEAFERARVPYFDGFSGSYRPFLTPQVCPTKTFRLDGPYCGSFTVLLAGKCLEIRWLEPEGEKRRG